MFGGVTKLPSSEGSGADLEQNGFKLRFRPRHDIFGHSLTNRAAWFITYQKPSKATFTAREKKGPKENLCLHPIV